MKTKQFVFDKSSNRILLVDVDNGNPTSWTTLCEGNPESIDQVIAILGQVKENLISQGIISYSTKH